MIRSIGTTIVLGLLVWGGGLCALSGNLNASEPIVSGGGVAYNTVTDNVKHVVAGEEYKGVLEISHLGIAHVGEYVEWLEFIPWNRVVGWKCFGSKQRESDEEELCTLWMQVQKGSSIAGTHLFFKVPCEMVTGKENWEVLEAFDPRGRFQARQEVVHGFDNHNKQLLLCPVRWSPMHQEDRTCGQEGTPSPGPIMRMGAER